MKIVNHSVLLYGKNCNMELMEFDHSDRVKWRELWDSWSNLKKGLSAYKSRHPNLPEGLSETAFCIHTGSHRMVSVPTGFNSSFDTFNIANNEAEQVKACSVEADLTSFGPKSKWDRLYFLDFYNNGLLDGRFDIYELDTSMIKDTIINKGKRETFLDQQEQGRRPRLSLKKLIELNGIRPIESNVRI